ncbi:MAG TPA: imidazoleglycerol-phosphate dehydratase HisB [Sphingobacteriaceae bacterium]|nr:imidazoleglycerol-phosphate dehydratase HisB [Sphingobacteriaceae bacterium]
MNASRGSGEPRKGSASRATKETQVEVTVVLDTPGDRMPEAQVDTGVPFLDHMLTALASTARWDLQVKAKGDIEVDIHHTVEDVGITLGRALKDALGVGRGMARYGSAAAPMDDALVLAAVDISGRPYAEVHGQPLPDRAPGGFHTDMLPEWLWGLARGGGLTLHIHVLAGRDAHHILEAAYKALGLALGQATAVKGSAIPSTKGTLWD